MVSISNCYSDKCNQMTSLNKFKALSLIISFLYYCPLYSADIGMKYLYEQNLIESDARAISSDGLNIVGFEIFKSGYKNIAYKYSDGSIINLGTLGGDASRALGISSNGKIIVGDSTTSTGKTRAFRYTDIDGMKDIGTLGGDMSSAVGISGDGRVIVGVSSVMSGERQAFKHGVNGMINLGTLGGRESHSFAASFDGAVVTGWAETDKGERHAFKHADASMRDLGTLGGIESFGYGISADGSIIVGSSTTKSGNSHAFKHTESGGMVDLGTLGGDISAAYGVSANGDTVVGMAQISDGQLRAFRYTGELGMVNLGTLGGILSIARAVNADGTVVVGLSTDSEGLYKSFVWRASQISDGTVKDPDGPFEEPSDPSGGTMVDVENTRKSMNSLAKKTYHLIDMHAAQLFHLVKLDADSSVGDFSFAVNESVAFGNNENEELQTILVGYRFADKIRAGILYGANIASISEGNISKPSDAQAFGAYIAYDKYQDRTGLGARVSLAISDNQATFEREKLAFTEASESTSDIHGTAIIAEVFYGFDFGRTTIIPNVWMNKLNVSRDAYDEDSSLAFPASMDTIKSNYTKAGLGLTVEHELTSRLKYALSSGVSQILDSDNSEFRGSIDYIGVNRIESPHRRDTMLRAGAKTIISITDYVTSTFGVDWSQQYYGDDIVNVNMGIQFNF
ncbi:hypothetical protein [Desulfomicrobium salsuginis]